MSHTVNNRPSEQRWPTRRRAHITLPPRWVSAQRFYVWVSAWWQFQRCNQNLHVPERWNIMWKFSSTRSSICPMLPLLGPHRQWCTQVRAGVESTLLQFDLSRSLCCTGHSVPIVYLLGRCCMKQDRVHELHLQYDTVYTIRVTKCALTSIMHLTCCTFPQKIWHRNTSVAVNQISLVHFRIHCTRGGVSRQCSTWIHLGLYTYASQPTSCAINGYTQAVH